MKNPKFNSLLDQMKEIHDRKNSDYSEDSNPYSNFEFAAQYAQIPVYKVYLVLEAVKTARLHQLHSGKVAKNESINDTYLDKATYSAIESSHLMVVDESKIEKEHDFMNTDIGRFCKTHSTYTCIATIIK
jgi:hypothetical protein